MISMIIKKRPDIAKDCLTFIKEEMHVLKTSTYNLGKDLKMVCKVILIYLKLYCLSLPMLT